MTENRMPTEELNDEDKAKIAKAVEQVLGICETLGTWKLEDYQGAITRLWDRFFENIKKDEPDSVNEDDD